MAASSATVRRRRTTLPRSTRAWSRGIVWSLIALTGFGVVYGCLARIDTSITARGKLGPVQSRLSVSAPINGLVAEVLVDDGQRVSKDQPLVRMYDPAGEARLRDLKAIQRQWADELQRLEEMLKLPLTADVAQQSPAFQAYRREAEQEVDLREQAAALALERARLDLRQQRGDLAGLRQQLTLNLGILERLRRLQREGATSELEVERQQEQTVQLQTKLHRQQLEVISAQRRVEESTLKANHIPVAENRELFARYANARLQWLEAGSQLAEQRQRVNLQTVRAPASGMVANLNISEGEVSSASQPLLTLLASGPLEANLDITNTEIGFVRKGMAVEVRIDSYPFMEYGALQGTVESVSVDAQPATSGAAVDVFPVVVSLARSELTHRDQVLQLRSGMAVTALIKLKDRPVISLITDRFAGLLDSTRSMR